MNVAMTITDGKPSSLFNTGGKVLQLQDNHFTFFLSPTTERMAKELVGTKQGKLALGFGLAKAEHAL